MEKLISKHTCKASSSSIHSDRSAYLANLPSQPTYVGYDNKKI